jgi:DNA mismatch endonuclease (patch repair protein)
MTGQARRDTRPELALRRALWARGLRYRVDIAPIKGLRRRADILFTRARVAVLVDGCFWHRCPEHSTTPRANGDWWSAKLSANVERDRDTDRRLKTEGWHVERVWEHEPMQRAADRIERIVRARCAALMAPHTSPATATPELRPPSEPRA